MWPSKRGSHKAAFQFISYSRILVGGGRERMVEGVTSGKSVREVERTILQSFP